MCFIVFLWFWDVFVSLPLLANQELASRTRHDDIQDLVHHVLAMHRIAPKLIPELLRDEHRDRAVVQASSSSLEVLIDEILVGNRTKLLGAPRDGSPIDESTSLLVRLEGDEDLAHHANTLALVVLHLPSREVANLTHRLALELVDVTQVVVPVILGPLIATRLVVRVGLVIVGALAEPGVGAGLAAAIRRATVHVEGRREHARTLTTVAVAHLVTDGLENLVVGQLRGNLDDDRANLEPPSRGVDVAKHLLVRRLGHTNGVAIILRDLAPEDRRSVGQDAIRHVVAVCDTDATVTIGDPEASLRDSGVGTVVSSERHV